MGKNKKSKKKQMTIIKVDNKIRRHSAKMEVCFIIKLLIASSNETLEKQKRSR